MQNKKKCEYHTSTLFVSYFLFEFADEKSVKFALHFIAFAPSSLSKHNGSKNDHQQEKQQQATQKQGGASLS